MGTGGYKITDQGAMYFVPEIIIMESNVDY